MDGLDDRTRHRLLGNRRLQTHHHPDPGNVPRQSRCSPHVHTSTDDYPVADQCLGPPPKLPWTTPLLGLNEESHWQASCDDPEAALPQLGPALERLLQVRLQWRHDLSRIRQDVVWEIGDTNTWMEQRPSVSGPFARPTRIGPLRPWSSSTSCNASATRRGMTADTTSHHTRTSTLRQPGLRQTTNVQQQAAPYADVMLKELIDETRLGRVIGPSRGPEWWPTQT